MAVGGSGMLYTIHHSGQWRVRLKFAEGNDNRRLDAEVDWFRTTLVGCPGKIMVTKATIRRNPNTADGGCGVRCRLWPRSPGTPGKRDHRPLLVPAPPY